MLSIGFPAFVMEIRVEKNSIDKIPQKIRFSADFFALEQIPKRVGFLSMDTTILN